MDPLDVITEAGKLLHTVSMVYEKASGERKEYSSIEPYEFKEGKFWGYDTEADSIKQFNLAGIVSAEDTGQEFSPRWSVQF